MGQEDRSMLWLGSDGARKLFAVEGVFEGGSGLELRASEWTGSGFGAAQSIGVDGIEWGLAVLGGVKEVDGEFELMELGGEDGGRLSFWSSREAWRVMSKNLEQAGWQASYLPLTGADLIYFGIDEKTEWVHEGKGGKIYSEDSGKVEVFCGVGHLRELTLGA